MVIVPIGADGRISLFNEMGSTDVLVDVLGWFPVGPSFTGLPPGRLLDTRVPSGGTVDGESNGIGQLGSGTTLVLKVSGRGGVPAAGAGSVALNVTVARPSQAGFLTVRPSGQQRPNASNLNFTPAQTVANMVIAPIGTGGAISIFNETGSTDVLVDVLGWFPTSSSFTGLTPARLLDSRRPLPPSATTPPPASRCSPAYPTVCIPPPPPDLDCGDITHRRFTVRSPDPHDFDADKNGIGCEFG